ncbi:ubiquitin-conjugating enzyme 32 [Prunus dulcis]|uniref:Ubiquitin-conjugating enzyme 32 n=1 Tax=Prunus dulcis TaxID=3755 RepID=A0A4Y1RG53_PRUDU|nr:ubiquitin-conjugating enzyme 32 [Prunus dulcis]BBH02858.1 ubiquitin-conjugating enzyme 32 [Prunus dulcis]
MESFKSEVEEECNPFNLSTFFKPYKMIKPFLSRLIQKELEEMQANPSADFKCLALEVEEEHNPFNMSMMTKLNLSIVIQIELEEMQSNPSADFKCLALESNPRDWQFAIRGPNGTEFEGGIYHGRIKIPEEYPDKPPIITLLTENGRFKTQTEIDYFDYFYKWGPSKTVRNGLRRLIELLPTYPDGALGSVEYDKEERRVLAFKSRLAPPIYGTDERQKLINEIHEYMLSKTTPVPSNSGGDIRVRSQNDRDRKRKRTQEINLFFGNTIRADRCERVGFFDFGKRLRSLWSWS